MTDAADDRPSNDWETRLIDAGEREAAELLEATAAAKPPPDSVPGFAIIEEIGRGGMGVVYKALQLSTKRVVALKVILAGVFASRAARRRFQREVELAARFQHPGIVRVLESGLTPLGQQYYAMDYVEGIHLSRWLSVEQPDVRATLGLFVELCEAVEHAHRHGVVHRDLKPANVLIDADGKPHILDFGLSKSVDETRAEETAATALSCPGQIMGTLRYLAPEQAAGEMEEIDAQADVYALGVMLFEALTGAVPYDTSGHASDVMLRIREAPPTLPSRLSSRVDRELDTILLKALEKEKSRRYQSVAELGEDIGRYLRDDPIRARRPSRFYVLRKNVHKHRRWVVVGAAALALGLIGLWSGSEWRHHSLERQRVHELTQARRHLLLTQHLLETGRHEGARDRAAVVAEQYGELPEACLVLAQAKFREPGGKGRVYAVELLQKELRYDSSNWSCATLLAEMYRITGDDARAAELEAQLERGAPETGEEWYVRSFATMNAEEALRCAEEAVKRQPTHVLAWERLTGLCLLTGDHDRALDAMDMLTRIGEDPGLWAGRKAEFYVSQRRFREALAQCDVLLGNRDTAPDAYRYRAHIKRHQGRYDEAIRDYTTAIALLPKTREQRSPVWIHYQRATPLWIVGRTKEAAEDYRRVRTYLGRAFYGDARLYLILRDDGQRDEAQKVLNNALEGVVDDPWLTKILQCLAGQLAPDELTKDALSRDNPEHLCEAYYYAGEAHRLSGGLEKARDCFEKCLATGVEYDLNTPFEPMNEYELAQWRLAQPDSTTDATSQRARP